MKRLADCREFLGFDSEVKLQLGNRTHEQISVDIDARLTQIRGLLMDSNSPTLVSLFSGCGGFDLGFIKRGFHAKAAYDIDEESIQNYVHNVGPFISRCDLTLGIPNDQALIGTDVLIAGPPCQGFSTAGKRIVDDRRNYLVPLTASLAMRIRPKVLVVENVGGALSGSHAQHWNAMDAMMRQSGYRTHTVVLQASDLGMAQLRRRIFLFAWRTNRDIRFLLPKRPKGTLRTVLTGVSAQRNHKPKMLQPNSREWRIAIKIKPGQKLSNVRGGQNAVATWQIPEVFGNVSESEQTVLELLRRLRRQQRQRDRGDADPVSLLRLESALGYSFHQIVESLIEKGYLRRFEDGVDLVGTFNGKFRRLSWDGPSCTVDTRFGSPRYFLHPCWHRGFTVREASRIQGFDDSYVFKGREQEQYRMIGNAVPPPLSALAAEYAKSLLGISS